jgi:hypothetical protein
MRRLGLFGVFVVLLLPAGSGDRLLPLHQPPAATSIPTGFVYEAKGIYRLAQVDPATLAVTRTSASLSQGSGVWARSPHGDMLVLGTSLPGSYETTELQFADPATLALVGKPVRLPGLIAVAIWPAPRSVFAIVAAPRGASLVTVDVESRKIVAERSLGGTVVSSARFDGGLVLLLGVDGKLAPARLAVVHPDGLVRTVRLARIRVGDVWTDAAHGIGQTRRPGLAVDDDGRNAFVVDAGWLVAAVELATLRVAYHRPPRTLVSRLGSWLTPTAEAKGLSGPVRTARWLGDGLIAVSGSDHVFGARVVIGKQNDLYDVVDAETGAILRSNVAQRPPAVLLGLGS